MQSANKKENRTRNKLILLNTFVVLLIVTLGTLYLIPIRSHWYKCAICNRSQNSRVSFYGTKSRTIDNVCSEWVAQNFHQLHEHQWVENSDFVMLNFYGIPMGGGSRSSRDRWVFTPGEQLQIYQNAADQEEAYDLFVSIYETWRESPEQAWPAQVYLKDWPTQKQAVSWAEARQNTLEYLQMPGQ